MVCSLGLLGVLVAFWPGCQSFHSYRPVTVQAIDAETKKPIPQAEVRITYPLTQQGWAPSVSVEPTGSDGIAHLRAAPYGPVGLTIAASANGYTEEATAVPVAALAAIPTTAPHEKNSIQPANFVVEMYAKPNPTVELTLPPNYRGLVKTRLRIQEAVYTPGQRLFTCFVPATGETDIVVPPLFRRTPYPEYHARYPDGPLLSPKARLSEIGFWWLKADGDTQVFLVGTEKEHADRLAADKGSDSRGGQGSDGGGRGGKGGGRKGRGGQQQPTDGSS
jgi:hypothetical protein